MTDYEVERALGYSPCVCGVLNGTWHRECYSGKTQDEVRAGKKSALTAARRHLKRQAEQASTAVISAARHT